MRVVSLAISITLLMGFATSCSKRDRSRPDALTLGGTAPSTPVQTQPQVNNPQPTTVAETKTTPGGDVVGNGGNALVCDEGAGKNSVRLLDFYEADLLRGIKYDLGAAELEPMAK